MAKVRSAEFSTLTSPPRGRTWPLNKPHKELLERGIKPRSTEFPSCSAPSQAPQLPLILGDIQTVTARLCQGGGSSSSSSLCSSAKGYTCQPPRAAKPGPSSQR